MSEETKVEMTEEPKPQTFTQEDVEKMISEATSKANGEAASFRHKLREIEEQKEKDKQKQLEEQGEFKTLAEQKSKELEGVMGRVSEMEAKLTEYQARDEAELKELLAKIPEGLGEEFESDSIPLSVKLSLARKLAGKKDALHSAKLPGEGDVEITSKADLKTSADKAAFINKHGRDKYMRLPEK
jgi:ribosomal protein L19E